MENKLIMSCNIVQKLDDSDFIKGLKEFCDLLKSSIGPKGGIKIIISEAGYMTVTSSSKRLVDNLPLENYVCVYICQIVKSQINVYHDCGLFTGILTGNLLKNFLVQKEYMEYKLLKEMCCFIGTKISSVMDSDDIKMVVDFSTIQQLIVVVRCIIESKPVCGLQKKEIDDLCVQIVKAFLCTLDDELGYTMVLCDENYDGSPKLFEGILYQVSDLERNISKIFDITNVKKILLFTSMLTPNLSEFSGHESSLSGKLKLELKQRFYDCMEKVINKAGLCGVNVVMCQKVVDSEVKLCLHRKGIMVLDRLGQESAESIATISEAIPIDNVSKLKDLEGYIGKIDVIKKETIGSKNYFVIQGKNKKVTTLVAGGRNEEAAVELKLTIEKALGCLKQLITHPYVLPGAGCFETWMAVKLQQEILNHSPPLNFTTCHLRRIILGIQSSYFQAAGLPARPVIDTIYFHSWNDVNAEKCCCRLVQSEIVKGKHGKWKDFNIDFTQLSTFPQSDNLQKLVIKNDSIVDVYRSKCNAVKLSFEAFINLSYIGLIVYKKHS